MNGIKNLFNFSVVIFLFLIYTFIYWLINIFYFFPSTHNLQTYFVDFKDFSSSTYVECTKECMRSLFSFTSEWKLTFCPMDEFSESVVVTKQFVMFFSVILEYAFGNLNNDILTEYWTFQPSEVSMSLWDLVSFVIDLYFADDAALVTPFQESSKLVNRFPL